MINNLEATVIEHLVDSDFNPDEHEAYAYSVEDLPTHRIGGVLIDALNKLDWAYIEAAVYEIKHQVGR